MKKRKVSAEIKYDDYGSQKALSIYLDYSLSKEMCLNFMMLYRGLVESLEAEFKGFSITFKVTSERRSRCISLKSSEKKAELVISSNALGSIVNFLLKYFRDDIGEAEHIDLDFQLSDHEEFTLTFVLDKFKMLSPAEMENLLRD